MLGRGVLIGAADYMFLEAAKECGKTGAAAERDDAEAAVSNFRFARGLFHVRIASSADTSLYRKEFNWESVQA